MEGLKLGLMPFGAIIGSNLPKKSPLPLVLFITLLLGIGVTFAEPAIGALKAAGQNVSVERAPYLYALLNDWSDELVLVIGACVGLAEPEPQPHEIVLTDFVGSLKQALQSYLKESRPTIELAAEICSTSIRSLQRKLKSCGSTYSELVDQVHFDTARILLQDQDINVTDIAHALSFDDASHFSRTFRPVAGVSPREFRQQAV